ncbi:MAG TPA: ScbR family autoregulator-binding transcription factor [Amycolatopsis sp.]|nr:ScbR family autoregulator-binding transcription factor [Amycolatopsis sp.]
MVKQARAEVTREAIIRGAAEVFDRYGYEATSLSDVMAAAGVTKGALYFHFSSKEDLANTVIERQHARSVGPAWDSVDDGGGLEAVIRLSHHLAAQLRADPVVRAGIRLTLETGTFNRTRPDPYQDWIDAVAVLLRRASDAGELRAPIDPEPAARYFVGAFTGVQVLSEVLTGRVDVHERVREMWELQLPALVSAERLAHYLTIARAPVEMSEG